MDSLWIPVEAIRTQFTFLPGIGQFTVTSITRASVTILHRVPITLIRWREGGREGGREGEREKDHTTDSNQKVSKRF